MERPFGLVLAAGKGARMGGHKALLELDGALLLQRHIERLEVVCSHVGVIVPSRQVDALRGRVHAQVIASDAPTQAGSLALGVFGLRAATGLALENLCVMITPVDLLPASPSTLRALLGALGPDTLAATPRFGGRGGHPVLVCGALLSRLFGSAGEPPSLRQLLEAEGLRRRYVDVDDPNVLGDFDTPGQARGAGLTLPPRSSAT